jgi:hypothetical protein
MAAMRGLLALFLDHAALDHLTDRLLNLPKGGAGVAIQILM